MLVYVSPADDAGMVLIQATAEGEGGEVGDARRELLPGETFFDVPYRYWTENDGEQDVAEAQRAAGVPVTVE